MVDAVIILIADRGSEGSPSYQLNVAFWKKPNAKANNVRFGSKADICSAKRYVRFTPNSGHARCTSPCPLCANSGHSLSLAAVCEVISQITDLRRDILSHIPVRVTPLGSD